MLIVHFDKLDRAGYFVANEQITPKEAKFKGKILGPPFPSAYHLRKSRLTVFARLSEFEPINQLFDKFLVDPLASWGVDKYLGLFEQASPNHELIVMCPSCHGHNIDSAVAKAALEYPVVKALITATPDVVRSAIESSHDSAQ